MNNKILISLVIVFLALVSIGFAGAATQVPTVCCEKTLTGLTCQDVPQEQCDPSTKQVPTSCKATSYCKPGTCFDVRQGTCLDNTPQLVCKGIWTEKPGAQCDLGCCILGDQAAFVTPTRCKKLASDLGISTNFKKEIKSEVNCVSTVLGQEKGACVYTSEFQELCRITTRADCAGGASETQIKGAFFKGKLCTAKDLNTTCGPSDRLSCVAGKEEVYAIDSCGNPSNIYNGNPTKQNWEDMLDKSEIDCTWASTNPNCGNCNYLGGNICRTDKKGTSKCTDLNCYGNTAAEKAALGGKVKRLHGESWCVYSDKGEKEGSNNAVGSRFYKHVCVNGEVVLEQCDDFRQQVCVESETNYAGGIFSQAACRPNRWQTCTMQGTQSDCENSDQRDCTWLSGRCVPIVSPGLKFWEGEEAKDVCGQASVTCVAKYEENVFGKKDWKGACVDFEGHPSQPWWNAQSSICYAVGDCSDEGALELKNKVNWLGIKGR